MTQTVLYRIVNRSGSRKRARSGGEGGTAGLPIYQVCSSTRFYTVFRVQISCKCNVFLQYIKYLSALVLGVISVAEVIHFRSASCSLQTVVFCFSVHGCCCGAVCTYVILLDIQQKRICSFNWFSIQICIVAMAAAEIGDAYRFFQAASIVF